MDTFQKTNDFVASANKNYASFQVFKMMKDASKLLDNISNWYAEEIDDVFGNLKVMWIKLLRIIPYMK